MDPEREELAELLNTMEDYKETTISDAVADPKQQRAWR